MVERRSTYFAFQGLLVAVLMLVFVYEYHGSANWFGWFLVLSSIGGGSLVLLKLVPGEILSLWWFQAGLFIGDAVLASVPLSWVQPHPGFYLIYFLIIFGTALVRNLSQSIFVAIVTALLYLFSGWDPIRGFPHEATFWLRFQFLLVTSSLLAILSRDSQRALADQNQRYRQSLIDFERLATLGQIAGEVAHRIKGPLTTIMVNADVLSQRLKSKDNLKELAQIRDEAGHCKEILKNLLDLGRIEETNFGSFDLREVISEAIKMVDPQIRKRDLSKTVSGLGAPLPAIGDSFLMQEAIGALLQNAVEASRDGGAINLRVKTENISLGGGERSLSYTIMIEDEGEGIAPREVHKIFQPFFTTKPRGHGLGLSAALRIIQKHGGNIEAYSEGPGRGSRFVATIPVKMRRDGAPS